MMAGQFQHIDLRLVMPKYDSPLNKVIMDLQPLRRMRLFGTTSPPIFFQLKDIFHFFESLESASIEGNRTTIAELVESRIERSAAKTEGIKEIENMRQAMAFLESNIQEGSGFNKAIVRQLHAITVEGLQREGDKNPGYFRRENVEISGSKHKPPDYMQVEDYLEELFRFINLPHDPRFDLLRIAIAHHRFAWIHPFSNGNGRVVRLLTYGMIIERGFNVSPGRLLNPSAVFCADRDTYYSMLSRADQGGDEGILSWCEYVLKGLLREITKIDRLLDHKFLSERILNPAIDSALDRKTVTKLEAKILKVAIRKQVFRVADIVPLTPGKIPAERSRILARLRREELVKPVVPKARKYVVNFTNNHLLRGVVDGLQREAFLASNISA